MKTAMPRAVTPLALAALLCLALIDERLHAQVIPASQTTTVTSKVEVKAVELSPFVVNTSGDQGYYSSQTLAGGRLKTDLKDVATSVQVVTEAMFEDLGVTNLNDLLTIPGTTTVVPIKDVAHPYYVDGSKYVDFWVGYRRRLFGNKVGWRVQLNIRNVLADSDPVVVQVQPDGSPARVSMPVPRQFVLSNTFSF